MVRVWVLGTAEAVTATAVMKVQMMVVIFILEDVVMMVCGRVEMRVSVIEKTVENRLMLSKKTVIEEERRRVFMLF